MSRSESLRLLRNVSYGRIVFISRALPAIRLIPHVMDDGALLTGLPGDTDLAALLTKPAPVVYEADLLDPATRLGWSVTLTGRAGPLTDPDELGRAMTRLKPWPGRPIDLVARIQPELVTGFHTFSP
ncbi:pyridoxamine 5'-phosphate oxidase family protein [Nonomuraea maheshkhaliensis]|uniref:Pyridoxamine 5'-phosphate oxidase family protein n=1 Tax=Nonomuraea maheshkhaliensis TaxID=419590 RepID=A0ABN2HNB2_9ACTN